MSWQGICPRETKERLWQGTVSIGAGHAGGRAFGPEMVNFLMILLGLSWTGWGNLLHGWALLPSLRGSKGDTRFYCDRLEDVDEGVCVSYRYTKMKAVFEGRRAFYLQVEAKRFMVLILQKKHFTQGEPGEFRRFMDKQCGKPVITV